jgi:hypothetical protein
VGCLEGEKVIQYSTYFWTFERAAGPKTNGIEKPDIGKGNGLRIQDFVFVNMHPTMYILLSVLNCGRELDWTRWLESAT